MFRRGTSTGIISKITSQFVRRGPSEGEASGRTDTSRSTSREPKERDKEEGKDSKPRSLRFTWSMKTTSSMDPNDMMREIRKVLDANNCDYEQKERFLLFCVHGDARQDSLVQWEVGDGSLQIAPAVTERGPLQVNIWNVYCL